MIFYTTTTFGYPSPDSGQRKRTVGAVLDAGKRGGETTRRQPDRNILPKETTMTQVPFYICLLASLAAYVLAAITCEPKTRQRHSKGTILGKGWAIIDSEYIEFKGGSNVKDDRG